MDDWPIQDSDLRLIEEFFKEALRDQPSKPLLEYMRRNNLGWDDVAPTSHSVFTRGEVHYWRTGKRKLTLYQIARIKKASNIPDSEVPCLSDREIYSGAAAETLMMIREQWFGEPGERKKIITPHQVLALEYAMRQRERDVERRVATDWIGVFQVIRQRLPQAGLRNLEDFTQFRKSLWIHAHAAFKDALREGNLVNEFEQKTNM